MWVFVCRIVYEFIQFEVVMKKIEVIELPVSEIRDDFGNPRKVTQKKLEELNASLEEFGDFGVIVVDENNDVISGNQRVKVLKEKNPDEVVLCKRLIGYSKSEKRAINIKANSHAGDWDLDLLADWTADLNVDLGIDPESEEVDEKKIADMELIHYEKYDYVLIACKYETDYMDLVRRLGIEDKKVPITNKRKIKARAIWYDNIKAQILYKEEASNNEKA